MTNSAMVNRSALGTTWRVCSEQLQSYSAPIHWKYKMYYMHVQHTFTRCFGYGVFAVFPVIFLVTTKNACKKDRKKGMLHLNKCWHFYMGLFKQFKIPVKNTM